MVWDQANLEEEVTEEQMKNFHTITILYLVIFVCF